MLVDPAGRRRLPQVAQDLAAAGDRVGRRPGAERVAQRCIVAATATRLCPPELASDSEAPCQIALFLEDSLYRDVRAAQEDVTSRPSSFVVSLCQRGIKSRHARAADTSLPGIQLLLVRYRRGRVAASEHGQADEDQCAQDAGNALAIISESISESAVRDRTRQFVECGLIVLMQKLNKRPAAVYRARVIALTCGMALSASARSRITAMDEGHARGFQATARSLKTARPVRRCAHRRYAQGARLMRASQRGFARKRSKRTRRNSHRRLACKN